MPGQVSSGDRETEFEVVVRPMLLFLLILPLNKKGIEGCAMLIAGGGFVV